MIELAGMMLGQLNCPVFYEVISTQEGWDYGGVIGHIQSH